MSTLTGHVTGNSRQDLINQAHTEAIQYYGNECVTISLSHEQASTDYIYTGRIDGSEVTAGSTTYTADYEATIQHKWDQPARGRPACRTCGTHSNNR